jgi:hypothetical protein
MGSIVYIGLIFGSILSGTLFRMFQAKLIIIASMVLFLLFMSFFLYVPAFNILLFARIAAGFF